MSLLIVVILAVIVAAVVGFFVRAFPAPIGENMAVALRRVFWPIISVGALHGAIALMFPQSLMWAQAHVGIYAGGWLMAFALWAASGHWATRLLSIVVAVIMIAYLISSNIPANWSMPTLSAAPAATVGRQKTVRPVVERTTYVVPVVAFQQCWSERIEVGTSTDVQFETPALVDVRLDDGRVIRDVRSDAEIDGNVPTRGFRFRRSNGGGPIQFDLFVTPPDWRQ